MSIAAAPGPRVILIKPQLGENIGASARAMLNCGLDDLAIVAPRDVWPNPKAVAMASGAGAVLDRARVVDTLRAATGDLHLLYAATARSRDMIQRVLTPRAAALEMRAAVAAGQRVGVLFGPERSGLTTDDVAEAQAVIAVPLNPEFSSLNLAQAVLLVAYEWYQADAVAVPERFDPGDSPPAAKQGVDYFVDRLERDLDAAGYFPTEEQRPTMRRNLVNLLNRARVTQQELRTLHGVVQHLAASKRREKL
ncbi:MAG: RNA methyltransferase [Alphaproteobacteria bacterium]|nr:RNA methyltransferase [Alphaproteobacteria bacterium]